LLRRPHFLREKKKIGFKAGAERDELEMPFAVETLQVADIPAQTKRRGVRQYEKKKGE